MAKMLRISFVHNQDLLAFEGATVQGLQHLALRSGKRATFRCNKRAVSSSNRSGERTILDEDGLREMLIRAASS